MTTSRFPSFSIQKWKVPVSFALGLGAIILFFLLSGCVTIWNVDNLAKYSQQINETHETIKSFTDLLSLVKDAETGQRGYVLTGDDKYLEPYNNALPAISLKIAEIEQHINDNPDLLPHMPVIEAQIHDKLDELAETVQLRHTQGFTAALAVVVSDRGKTAMDDIRAQLAAIEQIEKDIRTDRLAQMRDAFRMALMSGILASILGVLVALAIGYLVRRAAVVRLKQAWLQSGQVGLNAAMAGEQPINQLAENILKYLADYLDAHAAVFFIKDGNHYRRIATYGVPVNNEVPERFEAGVGLLGQAAKEARTIFIRDVPEGYLTIGSALGQGRPRHLVITPASAEKMTNAVLEIGFIHSINEQMVQFLEAIAEPLYLAIRSANYRAHLHELLEETQRQSEELQTQSEELRVSNEELGEQSRVLRESQARLEQQQAELEMTNSQLEEQTQMLEIQRDDLERSRTTVQQKAQELEQANRYKSDFLANMSHELRTPLNSSLILAKLLADNPDGNLTAEQVKYAETIQSSGNDLLALISDILDLSKIEAGYMEVVSTSITLRRMVDNIGQMFRPVAKQKNLDFQMEIDPGCPEVIEIDRQRIEQVLKNLLSNAFKFTEKGGVTFAVRPAEEGKIVFSISDTGIGIAEDQQQMIFDAFRQADSAISRKYGGTGLGLSISRELAALLGGTITVESEAGKGSTFTVTLPVIYDRKLAEIIKKSPISSPVPAALPAVQLSLVADTAVQYSTADDDRAHLTGNERTIMVIEDDALFARVLHDLVHELGFQCLVAGTATEALSMVKHYRPSAIVMDIGLPDHSGLFVLDRLKHNPHTRHIPVHVISASDYMQKAMELGAVGYMLKPVKRDEVVVALKKLENRLSHHVRRVLVVEDDLVQQESVCKLLAARDVEAVGVGTAVECLKLLKESTFDCMVLDLSLPDASGYSLLETLSVEEAYSFPPVIVYTGRDLSADDEQRLRRYSKSIIVKGAKSPERLLDEVTLFLHRMVSELPPEQQQLLEKARTRDAAIEGRHILVVEDDVRNVYALTSVLEPNGVIVHIARNGREALKTLEQLMPNPAQKIDLVLMDVMMPEMDGLAATREIRKNPDWKKLPIIMLTAKAMKDDQERCLEAGANDYMAKPLDVDKLLSLVRVWMPR